MDNLVFDVTVIFQNNNGDGFTNLFQVDDIRNVPVAVYERLSAADVLGFDVTMVTVTSRQEK